MRVNLNTDSFALAFDLASLARKHCREQMCHFPHASHRHFCTVTIRCLPAALHFNLAGSEGSVVHWPRPFPSVLLSGCLPAGRHSPSIPFTARSLLQGWDKGCQWSSGGTHMFSPGPFSCLDLALIIIIHICGVQRAASIHVYIV